MPRICALVAIESMEGIRMHGIVHTKIDYSILWACVKLAIYLIIIRERTRSKIRQKNPPNYIYELYYTYSFIQM